MSRHVAPTRWAQLAAGRVDSVERLELEAHAAACTRCHEERARVVAARAAFEAVAREQPPLGWESLGARLHWTISSEIKRGEREAEQVPERRRAQARRWLPRFLVSVVVLAAAGAAGFLVSKVGSGGERLQAQGAPATAQDSPGAPVVPAPAPMPAPGAVALEGLVTLAEGQALLDGKPLAPDDILRAGSRLATGSGRVHVQFGLEAGFVLEPRSVVELVAFDQRAVELRVEGAIVVQVTHRAPGQRFAVVATGRRVEVRGTVFRVAGGADGLEVACTRGRVSVSDGAGNDDVEVPAGSWLQVPLAVDLGSVRARPMTSAETLTAARHLHVSLLAIWPSRAGAQIASSLLRVSASADTQVSIDDVVAGRGPVVQRVAPGRHLIGAGGSSRWVATTPGVDVDTAAPSAPPSRISERAHQVEDQLGKHHGRFEVCANRIRGVDPDTSGELVIELEIGADGSLRSVVAVKGLHDQAIEECLLDVIRQQFTFPVGSGDTVRKSIRF